MCDWCNGSDFYLSCGLFILIGGIIFSAIHKTPEHTGPYLGWDMEYHAPNQMYAPGTNDKGERVTYRPNNELYGVEDGRWHNAGSQLGLDGKRHEANWFPGSDGRWHRPDAYYNIVTGRYSDVGPND